MNPLCRAALIVVAIASPAGAEDSGYGGTYTGEELAALDRALEAGNLRRADLCFDKALTKGHGCLAVVHEMLRDPLQIAAFMDGTVERLGAPLTTGSPGVAALREGVARLVEGELDSNPPEGAGFSPEGIDTPEALVSALTAMLARQPTYAADLFEDEDVELVLDALRVQLPVAMAWHEVFAAPLEGERQEAAAQWRKDEPAALHEAANRLDPRTLLQQWHEAFGDPGTWLPELPTSAFPADRARIVETPHGRIGLGTPGDDLWTGDFAALVDPGGNDRYERCRVGAAWGTAGRRVGFFADLGGDDVHDCGDTNVTLGAAVLGVAAFYDLGAGNDRYVGGHASLGAAMGGLALFHDDGGSDTYSGRTFTQGAAGFGVAVFMDDSVQARPETSTDEGTAEPVEIGLFDNDRLSAWANAQAFARARAVAYCINRRGNEIYEAGGVYLHAPLFSDRYQSFSQGFAIGERGIDWAGGIAMLIDHEGNDRYLGDIYDQGVGYWYGAGLLWDGLGNDTYEMTQYGQGSGIHLAVGGLVDGGGDDTYVMHSGLGQGGSHDFAASVLHDRGGNDRYHGSTSCNGCGLTNSVGLHFDRSGNDLYGARKQGGWNSGRPARDFSSIGVLVDLAGADDYMELGANDSVWRHSDIGLGIDVVPPPDEPAAAGTSEPDRPTGGAEIPEVCRYEGELSQEVFDELWEIAVRWEVGDNRVIVPEARKRLIEFGGQILPMLDGKIETDNSGLELRAFVGVLRGLVEAGDREGVLEILRANAASPSARRQTVALHLIGELKTKELEDAVVAILAAEDADLARRAAGVLGKLDSHQGDEILLDWVRGDDMRRAMAAAGVLVAGEADCWDALAPLLDADDFGLRTRLVTLLGPHLPAYRDGVLAALATDHPLRARRSALAVLARSPTPPDAQMIAAVAAGLADEEPYLRADAARVVRGWERREGADATSLAPLLEVVTTLAQDDPDPLVRSAATRARD